MRSESEAARERPVPASGNANQRKLEEKAAASLLKDHDRDRYWSALFAPAAARSGLFALYAFNAEMDRILSATAEPMAGQIRLKWWHDAIEPAQPGTKTGNPVADAVQTAIACHNLPAGRLTGMIESRIPAMFGEPPSGEKDLKTLLRETEGTVFELAAAILGDGSAATKDAAGYAGVAYGLTKMLLRLPFQAARQKLLIPSSYVESRRIDLTAVYRGETGASFAAAMADLRGVASRALQHFRSRAAEIDKAAWPSFLPLTLVKPYLREMAAPDFDPLRTIVSITPLRRFWRIWRAARRQAI